MKIIFICLALIGAVLGMPVSDKEQAEQLALPAAPVVKTDELPQSDAIPSLIGDKPIPVSDEKTEEKKPEVKSVAKLDEKAEVKPEASIPISEIKDPEVKKQTVLESESPETKAKADVVPETNPSKPILPEIEKTKTTELQGKSTIIEGKIVEAAVVKSEPSVDQKPEAVQAEVSKEATETKFEAITEIKAAEPTPKLDEKTEASKATVVEVSQPEAKSVPEKSLDFVKVASEMVGVAEDAKIDQAVIIPTPEKKIDLPVIPENSASLIPVVEQTKNVEDKKPEISPAITSSHQETPQDKSGIETKKIDALKSTESAPAASLKTLEQSEESLRVIRDTVEDKKKSEEPKPVDKPIEKQDDKPIEKSAEKDVKPSETEKNHIVKDVVLETKPEEPAKKDEVKAIEPVPESKSVAAVKLDAPLAKEDPKATESEAASSVSSIKKVPTKEDDSSEEMVPADEAKLGNPEPSKTQGAASNSSSEESSSEEDAKPAPDAKKTV